MELRRTLQPVCDENLPKPVKRDKFGRSTKDYNKLDWVTKVLEELHGAASADDYHLPDEITDVITVCTSWLESLGYDRDARAELQRQVNEKNAARGYFDEAQVNESEIAELKKFRYVAVDFESCKWVGGDRIAATSDGQIFLQRYKRDKKTGELRKKVEKEFFIVASTLHEKIFYEVGKPDYQPVDLSWAGR